MLASTYLGGTGCDDEEISSVVVHGGHVYVAGYTEALDFPTTPGAFTTTKPGTKYYKAAFVARMEAT